MERLLGKGGMGAVFEGYHVLVERRVAIKVLLPDAISSEHGAARFEREVRATGRIGNDHILEVYDVGVLPNGSRYMVSEFLDGETLADRLARGPLPPRAVAELMLQLLEGLGAAHEKGIIHRDLKPENLFIVNQKAGRTDFLKIIDFGISKYQHEDASTMGMTVTGAVIGTPYYLSPEQARGQRDIDHRSDLYTTGVIMYEAVSGTLPAAAENFNELLFKIALESPQPLSALVPHVDRGFSAIVERALERQREARFQSAHEMRLALTRWLEQQTVDAPLSTVIPSPPDRASWDPGNTVTASHQLPTSSNFGVSTVSALRRRSKARIAVFAGAVGIAAIGAAVFFSSTPTEPTVAAADSAPPTPRSASALPQNAVVLPDPLPTRADLAPTPSVVPQDEAPELARDPSPSPSSRADDRPERPPTRTRRPRSAAPAPPTRPADRSPAISAPTPPTPAATPPPPATASSRAPSPPAPATKGRDFGY
ncbi:MAG TPA: serine/threonine-protein kinase [Polyangiaceae bacterium]|nr:serine/threonine-protein kinase [Polyangiaceae bacterium]